MPNLKRVALYIRVSTEEQCTDNQLLDLRRYCQERGWVIADELIFIDHGISGAKDSRPSLNRMVEAIRQRRGIDVVLVWKFDRLSRSLKSLLNLLEEFRTHGVQLISFQECIDTSSVMGEAIMALAGIFAQIERSSIIERVHAGLRRAKLSGTKLGRPANGLDVNHAKKLRSEGLSIRAIGKAMKQPKSVVARALKAPIENVP